MTSRWVKVTLLTTEALPLSIFTTSRSMAGWHWKIPAKFLFRSFSTLWGTGRYFSCSNVGKIVLVQHNKEKDWWHFCSFHMNTRMVQREGQLCLGNRSRWINRIFLKKFSIGGRNGFLTSNKNSPGLFEGGGEAASWAAGMKLKCLTATLQSSVYREFTELASCQNCQDQQHKNTNCIMAIRCGQPILFVEIAASTYYSYVLP